MNKELFYGSIGGLTGQLISYPLDTIKTRLQSGQQVHIKNLYKGVASPLTSVIIEKAVLFASYDLIKTHFQNTFYSGVMAGIMTTFTVTPFERVKVRAQINKTNSIIAFTRILRNDGIISLYRGWTATLFREVPGYGLYFSTYEWIKKNREPSPFYSFLTGSASGIVAWSFIYPSDPVKTVMQNNNVSAGIAISSIYKRFGIQGFYRGFSWGIARAGLLHGGVFLGYETCKGLFQ